MNGLVVVDMQPGFDAVEEPHTFENVKKLIQKFLRDKKPIFFLEYKGYNPTHYDLLFGVYRYEQAYWIRKDRDDGSWWLDRLIQNSNLQVKDLVVCGINASFCVAETVRGLVKKDYNVVVPEGATCNAPNQIEEYGLDGARTLCWIQTRYPEKVKLHPVIELLGEEVENKVNL